MPESGTDTTTRRPRLRRTGSGAGTPRRRQTPQEAASPHSRPSRAGRKSRSVFVPVEVNRSLKLLQFRLETTRQQLLEKAVLDLIAKYRDEERPASSYDSSPDLKTWVKISVWLTREEGRYLDYLKLTQETTIQSLLMEAIDGLFETYRQSKSVPE